jgi:hypothetical protein
MRPARNDQCENRLPHCPMCRYSLQGLPSEHRCPECGLAFDAASRLWLDPFWPGWRAFLSDVFGRDASSRLRNLAQYAGLFLAMWVMSSITCAWMGLVLLFIVARTSFYDAQYRGIALVPDGVVVRKGRRDAKLYKWTEVVGVRAAGTRNYLDVCQIVNSEIDLSPSIRKPEQVRLFKLEVNRRKQQFQLTNPFPEERSVEPR